MKGHPSLKIEGKAVGKRPAFKTGSSRQGSSVSLAPSSVVRRSGSVGSLAAKPMPETASTSASPRGGLREINGRGREDLHHKKESRQSLFGFCAELQIRNQRSIQSPFSGSK
ncbi:hypothetical protein L596_015936 [Steinernema carpocapsae]|uniref:Uncharacterized protein n=1 Tax=Steinernema carpocapsae TaxID=34508 RepID=A0A4U5NHI6_STECR|nr:hypothetical protein L596_015936 [Steinernema carpocapsae]